MIRVFHPVNYAPIPEPGEFAGLNVPGSANEYKTASDVPAELKALDGLYVAMLELPDPEPVATPEPAPKPTPKSRKAS